MKKSGIYAIENLVNGKVYIGHSVSIQRRWGQHLSDLRSGGHTNSHLQASWSKYGEENFDFIVLEETSKDKSEMLEREFYWVSKYNSLDRKFGYNIEERDKDAKLTEESRRKIGEKIRESNKHRKERGDFAVVLYNVITGEEEHFNSIKEPKKLGKICRKGYNIPRGLFIIPLKKFNEERKTKCRNRYEQFLNYSYTPTTNPRSQSFYAINYMNPTEILFFERKKDFTDYLGHKYYQVKPKETWDASMDGKKKVYKHLVFSTRERAEEALLVLQRKARKREEHLNRIREHKTLIATNLSNGTVLSFDSVSEAVSSNYGFSRSGIFKVLYNGRKSHKGFTFHFETELNSKPVKRKLRGSYKKALQL